MDITIDEWVVHHIGDPDKLEAVEAFLNEVYRKCDRFVTIRGEHLDQRIFQLAKECATWEPRHKALAKHFISKFRLNPKKFHALEESEAAILPPDLGPDVPRKDVFLVRAALTTGSPILTTDAKLKRRLAHAESVQVRLLDEFLQDYDC